MPGPESTLECGCLQASWQDDQYGKPRRSVAAGFVGGGNGSHQSRCGWRPCQYVSTDGSRGLRAWATRRRVGSVAVGVALVATIPLGVAPGKPATCCRFVTPKSPPRGSPRASDDPTGTLHHRSLGAGGRAPSPSGGRPARDDRPLCRRPARGGRPSPPRVWRGVAALPSKLVYVANQRVCLPSSLGPAPLGAGLSESPWQRSSSSKMSGT